MVRLGVMESAHDEVKMYHIDSVADRCAKTDDQLTRSSGTVFFCLLGYPCQQAKKREGGGKRMRKKETERTHGHAHTHMHTLIHI
jgi:hypothetical protein